MSVLHNFTNADGQQPEGALVLAGNTLFGATRYGGAGSSGTIFKVNADGSAFATLYNFSRTGYNPANLAITNTDGANPVGGLLLAGNLLYGTTEQGGVNGTGTLFEIGTNGQGFTSLYDFTAGGFGATNLDGSNPYGGVVQVGTMLYTTTEAGGLANEGTIFELNLATAPPPLNVQFVTGTGIVISWPSSETGWTLQQNSNLTSTNWMASGLVVSDNGAVKSVTIPSPPGTVFYRLEK